MVLTNKTSLLTVVITFNDYVGNGQCCVVGGTLWEESFAQIKLKMFSECTDHSQGEPRETIFLFI